MEMEQTKRTQKNHHRLQTQVKRVRIYSKERQVDTNMQGPLDRGVPTTCTSTRPEEINPKTNPTLKSLKS